LKKEYPATSAVVLAGKLNRSLVSVQKQLREMGIARRDKTEWTAAQIKYLRKNYRETATWEIANKLSKTPSVVKHKAAELKLKKR
jgi:predicted transcriptional regulator